MPSVILAGTTTGTALSLTSDTSGELQIQTNNGATTAMTLTTGGNVGIGTSSPYSGGGVKTLHLTGSDYSLFEQSVTTATAGYQNWRQIVRGSVGGHVYQLQLMNDANSAEQTVYEVSRTANSVALQRWYGGTSEAMRIDSSGNLLVGTTSTTGRLSIVTQGDTSGTFGVYVKNSSSTDMFLVRNDGGFCTGVAGASPYNNTSASAANCGVASDGYLFRSTSSIKYKTDVQDATHGLAEVMQLRPVTYKGKTDGDTVFGGLIAEEVHEAGLTEFVQYAEDGSPDALAYGNMVSLLSKAIQEQQAMIETLTTRLNALEGN